MARAGLLDHRKFKRLVHLLKAPEPHVIGYLECLWIVAYQQRHPLIGDALDVHLACQYQGDDTAFIAAKLAECGFLDRTEKGYEVHDLYTHAPEYVQVAMRRAGFRASSSDDKPTPADDSPTDSDGPPTMSVQEKRREEKGREEIPSARGNSTSPGEGGVGGPVAPPLVPAFNRGCFPQFEPAAKRIVEAYQKATKTAHDPRGAQAAVVAVLASQKVTEAVLIDAVHRWAEHLRKTYPDPAKRLSAKNFFGGEAPAWENWINGSPVVKATNGRSEWDKLPQATKLAIWTDLKASDRRLGSTEWRDGLPLGTDEVRRCIAEMLRREQAAVGGRPP